MIVVSYTRKGDLFSGVIGITGEAGNVHFTGIPADKLVGLLHGTVSSSGIRKIVWECKGARADMPEEDVELLMTDPVAIVRRMNPPPIKIDLSGKKSGLVVGYDTLAHGFGDRLYCRVSGDRVECPGCGKWRVTSCLCKLDVEFEEHGKWASVSTEELLASGHKRFFFPRAWNKGKPWITREELEAKYQDYLKEKNHV